MVDDCLAERAEADLKPSEETGIHACFVDFSPSPATGWCVHLLVSPSCPLLQSLLVIDYRGFRIPVEVTASEPIRLR